MVFSVAHRLTLALRLIDTADGRPIKGRMLTIRKEGVVVKPMEKEDGYLILADMEVVERHNHGYVSAYMPFGMDATVDWSGPDYKFKNTTEYPIRIEAYASGGTVTVSIIGTDTKDYYVKMEYAVLDIDNYETVYEELPPDNEKGYKDGEVINDPYTGYTIETYQCRYDKETDELLEREFEVRSKYIKRDKLVCKIVKPKKDKDKKPSKKDKSVEATVSNRDE